jgi:hypothetical protein
MRCPDRRWIGDGTLRIGLTLTVVLVGGDGGSLDGPLIFSGRSSRGKSLSDALFARPRYWRRPPKENRAALLSGERQALNGFASIGLLAAPNFL